MVGNLFCFWSRPLAAPRRLGRGIRIDYGPTECPQQFSETFANYDVRVENKEMLIKLSVSRLYRNYVPAVYTCSSAIKQTGYSVLFMECRGINRNGK